MSIYFAESGPYMKIGYSADPTSRMMTVTRNGRRPHDLPFDADADLIGWIPGDRRAEARIHGRYASTRVEGEWFWSDRASVLELILADPRGVDFHSMSALAVLVMRKHPDWTREEVRAAGVPVEAVPEISLKRVFADLPPSDWDRYDAEMRAQQARRQAGAR